VTELSGLEMTQYLTNIRSLERMEFGRYGLLASVNADPWLPARLRAFSRLVTAEGTLYSRLVALLDRWASRLREAVFGSRSSLPDVQAIPSTAPWFTRAVDEVVDVEVREIFLDATDWEDTGELNANHRVEDFLRASRNRLARVPDRVYADVRRATMKATSEGWSIDDLETRIHGLLEDSGAQMWRNRARTIARTEAVGAFNMGRLAGFQSYAEQMGGKWEKVWLETHDHRTRPTHQEREGGVGGQRVPLSMPFKVGLGLGMAPGDPGLPPEEVINCRCSLLLAREGEPVDLSNRHFRRPA
jgi:F like protein